MTEERLRHIALEYGLAFQGDYDILISLPVLRMLEKAVNESLDEAAQIAMDNMLPKTSEEITNLKVK